MIRKVRRTDDTLHRPIKWQARMAVVDSMERETKRGREEGDGHQQNMLQLTTILESVRTTHRAEPVSGTPSQELNHPTSLFVPHLSFFVFRSTPSGHRLSPIGAPGPGIAKY
jgi:hypothetical protein